jgi:hypothetical protein
MSTAQVSAAAAWAASGTYASRTDPAIAGSLLLDASADAVTTPIFNFKAFGRQWQIGIDTSNHGGARDLFISRYNRRQVSDLATTNSSTTVTSATQAQFGPADNGVAITGPGIPAGATLIWASGTDSLTSARLSAAATATATGVTATIGTGNSVADVFYINDNGGNPATVGFGVTPPDRNYTLQVATSGAVGALRILATSGETGSPKRVTFQDSGATDRLWVNNDYSLQGLNAAWGGSVVIKGDVTNLRALSFVHPTSNQNTGFYFGDNTTLTLRAFTGGSDSVQFGSDGSFRHVSSKLGFFAAAIATKWGSLPADATDLATAIALINDIKNNVVKRYGLAA